MTKGKRDEKTENRPLSPSVQKESAVSAAEKKEIGAEERINRNKRKCARGEGLLKKEKEERET